MHGWLLIDKPEGTSSAHALSPLRRLLRKTKIGHTGTLDLLASGLLLVAVGEATKLINYAMDDQKEYEFTIAWGENRTTLDREGEVTETNPKIPTHAEIVALLPQFIGKIEQAPPIYSALKIEGKRAYALARAGEEVTLAKRYVDCHQLTLVEHKEMHTSFVLTCGKGFYVRSLARDIAAHLGCCGYVAQLRRTRLGKFKVIDAITLDYLEKLVHNAEAVNLSDLLHVQKLEVVLDDILVQQVTAEHAMRLQQGQRLKVDNALPPIVTMHDMQLVAVRYEECMVAMCNYNQGYLQPVRVFNIN